HVLGHVYANFITSTSLPGFSLPDHEPRFPLLAVILSGGHSQLVLFSNHFKYQVLGRTQDDAIGEAFDKVAKLLGLPYPGGPSISSLAKSGDSTRFKLPKAKMGIYDFSFSGLKTAVLRLSQDQAGVAYDFPSFRVSERLSEAQKADIAASFQRVAVETVMDKVISAVQQYHPKGVVLAGGVAANELLRQSMREQLSLPLTVPDPMLCTDNGAMIAALGGWQLRSKQPLSDPYSLGISPNLSM
ncbi:MAG: tRNA (adenosine(37)-N6)-threonylcarbamoyltransferase complex transferase subunit TsaD, partial [Candidatus Saccharimonadales bacterium]